jgi:hypothetical protein
MSQLDRNENRIKAQMYGTHMSDGSYEARTLCVANARASRPTKCVDSMNPIHITAL